MASVNKVIIVGNVGKDPEIRTFQNGGRVANMSVATSESWKDKATGDRKERVEWHRVVIMNEALVGVVEKFVKKGARLFIEGQLETRKWTDQSGADKYATEIVIRPYRGELTMLDGPKKTDAAPATQSQPEQAATGDRFDDDLNSEIPF